MRTAHVVRAHGRGDDDDLAREAPPRYSSRYDSQYQVAGECRDTSGLVALCDVLSRRQPRYPRGQLAASTLLPPPQPGIRERVSLTAITAIEAMVAPVVLITTGGILTNALLGAYALANDSMREMTRERIGILTGEHGELLDATSVSAVGQERLAEIDAQLPMMLAHHGLLRRSVIGIYTGLVILALSVIGIAIAVLTSSEALGSAALALVLAGTVAILAGLAMAVRTLVISANAITYAIQRTGALRKR
jgi:hypothetical protein